MNIQELTEQFASATEKLSAEERQLLLQAFKNVAAELDQE